MGSRSNNMGADVGGRSSHVKEHSCQAPRQAGFEGILYLPRIQKSHREKAFVVLSPVIRTFATSNGEQRVRA